MRVETILNDCHNFKSFVYKNTCWGEYKGQRCFEIQIHNRKNSQAICDCCHKPASLYDKLNIRRFEFVPFWGYRTFILYQMRRVDCKLCGVTVEEVPWGSGKHTLTKAYMKYLSDWARKLSWLDTARTFKTSWDKVFSAVSYVVAYGLQNRDISNVESIGIDEIAIQKGHKYITLVYQIDKQCTRLLWVGKDRTVKTLLKFFHEFGRPWSEKLKHICSDMWKPYLKVIKKKAPQALNILDRFHIVSNMNKAIDEVRAAEHRKLQEDGYEPVLKKSRWCLLKRKENLTEKQSVKLKDLLAYNLKSVKAYLLKEEFHLFWEYISPYWAEKFLDIWCTKVMRSKLEPMKKMAKSIRRHKPLILNWFKAKKEFSSGIVEGLNNKAKVATKKAYGFKTYKCAEIALYHQLGKLPEPLMTHRF
jgi:transposase